MGTRLIILLCATCFANFCGAQSPAANYLVNRAPLVPAAYLELPLGSIEPRGWLREQLERMAGGMTGRLDALYPSVVGPRNGWLGGDGDGWERGPYWVDGLLPLAYLLDNDTLKQKAMQWVDWTLENQAEDGYLGPVPFAEPPAYEPGLQRGNRRDWWPKMVMLKILQQYYSASEDARVIDALSRYFRYQLATLPERHLDDGSFWANRRGGDNLMVVQWLYNLTGEEYLLDLMALIEAQTFPWNKVFNNPPTVDFRPGYNYYIGVKPYPFDSSEINALSIADVGGIHTVNLAQGLKQPALQYQISGDKAYLESIDRALATLKKHHGQAQGMYGGDEPLHGSKPVQGIEFCSISEELFSLETIVKISGNMELADLAERIAYNALPTQAADDFMSRQYFQAANQVELREYSGVSFENHNHRGTDFVYGLLTGYPCCTTNMHQAWPKFARNLFYATPNGGVAAVQYAPSSVSLRVGEGQEIRITETTGYPFREEIAFTLEMEAPVTFPFHLRIPGWAGEPTLRLNGENVAYTVSDRVAIVERTFSDGDVLTLKLPMTPSASTWHDYSTAIERGPLVYALKVEDRRQVKDRDDGYGPFTEVYPTTPWNYGLMSATLKELPTQVEVTERTWNGEYPWNLKNAPIEIRIPAIRLPTWEAQNGVPHLPAFWGSYHNYSRNDIGAVTLIPYGCTTLRISQFPTVNLR